MTETDAAATNGIDMKRYDRQIRLWGLDTQRGLVGARILLLGVNGLANEIAKNLVLSGVGHVCVQDTGTLTKEDVATGGLFSVSETQLGVGKAEALATELKEMNPSVHLTSTMTAAHAIDPATLRSYNYIVATRGLDAIAEITAITAALEQPTATTTSAAETPAAKKQKLSATAAGAAKTNGSHIVLPMRAPTAFDAAAGSASAAVDAAAVPTAPMPKMFAAGCIGLDGFCFCDFGVCTARIAPPKKAGEDAAASAAKAVPPHTERALYPPVAAAAGVAWAALTPRVPRLFYALQLLGAVREGGAPAPPDLLKALTERRDALLADAGANTEGATKLLSDEYLSTLAQTHAIEFAPVAAVVGGMVAAEVTKLIGGKDKPINNALFFDGTTSDGIVVRLGPSYDAPWGRDTGDFKRVD